jgi:uncharacterized membrane protein
MDLNSTARSLWICQTCELIGLAIWIGGLVVIIASVIPAVFNTFGGQMEPAGRFLRRVFDGYNHTVAAASVLLAAGMAWRWWHGRRAGSTVGRPSRPELLLLAVMVGVAAVIVFIFGPHAIQLQEQAFAAQGEAAKKEAYDAFFRSHLIVRGLYILNLGLGVGLLAVKVKHWGANSQ